MAVIYPRPEVMRRFACLFAALLLALSACSTYRENLNRGQRMYDENEYERALAIWRNLEPDIDSLSPNDQARYAYLRGMTDYRLGFRPDARHWLAMAKAFDQANPGGLSAEWKGRTEEALNDLNKEVFGGSEKSAPAESASPAGAPTESAAPAQSAAPLPSMTAPPPSPSPSP
jgi:hypothetical protein